MKVIQRELSDMNGGAEDDVAEIENVWPKPIYRNTCVKSRV